MKIRTTSTGLLFLTGFVAFTALALTINGFGHHYQLYPRHGFGNPAQALAQAAQARTPAGVANMAASMMISGQRIGVLFALLLAAVATPLFLYSQHVSTSLAGWDVARSVLLNLLAFVAWGVFGLGLGAVLRSQIVAVIAAIAVYAGSFGTELVFSALYNFFHQGWMLGAPVIGPAVASEVMTTSGPAFPYAPPGWVGGVILIGYTVALVAGGVALTKRRDVT
jgi:ABC-2 type transport system permease protein